MDHLPIDLESSSDNLPSSDHLPTNLESSSTDPSNETDIYHRPRFAYQVLSGEIYLSSDRVQGCDYTPIDVFHQNNFGNISSIKGEPVASNVLPDGLFQIQHSFQNCPEGLYIVRKGCYEQVTAKMWEIAPLYTPPYTDKVYFKGISGPKIFLLKGSKLVTQNADKFLIRNAYPCNNDQIMLETTDLSESTQIAKHKLDAIVQECFDDIYHSNSKQVNEVNLTKELLRYFPNIFTTNDDGKLCSCVHAPHPSAPRITTFHICR